MKNSQMPYKQLLLFMISSILISIVVLSILQKEIKSKPAPSIIHEAPSQPDLTGLYKMSISWHESSVGQQTYRLNADLLNLSDKPVVFIKSGFGSNHSIMLENESGQEPPMTKQGAHAKALFENWPNRDQSLPVIVLSGNTSRETINLAHFYELKPGKYRLKVRFREQLWLSDPFSSKQQDTFMIDVLSNELNFEVKK